MFPAVLVLVPGILALPPKVKVEIVCGGGFHGIRGNDHASFDCEQVSALITFRYISYQSNATP